VSFADTMLTGADILLTPNVSTETQAQSGFQRFADMLTPFYMGVGKKNHFIYPPYICVSMSANRCSPRVAWLCGADSRCQQDVSMSALF